jgi:lipid-A-disaccharide synthase
MTGTDGTAGAAPLIFLIAGEPSGDVLGGRLMQALVRQTGGRVRFAGLGGEAMARHGLDSLFPIAELSLFGIFEVVPRIPRLLRRMRQTAAAIRQLRPQAVVTIDAPAFCFGVWRRLPRGTAPLIHYVAPTVWAWRPGRARAYAARIDHMMCLLPFEPPFFERAGLAASFVGHPVIEGGAGSGDGTAFRARHGIEGKLLCVLPGSRQGEVARLLPVFGAAVAQLAQRIPGLRVVVPTVAPVADRVARAVSGWAAPAIVVEGEDDKYAAFAAADVAIAASGTAVLELALAGLPMVVGYRINRATGLIVRWLSRIEHATLVNLLAGHALVPEFLQGRCTGAAIAAAAEALFTDEAARARQRAGFAALHSALRCGDMPPSARAAGIVLQMIAAGDRDSNAKKRENSHG